MSNDLQLNPLFISNIRQIYSSEGDAWLQALPSLLKKLSEQWNFRFRHTMHNLSFNYLGLVKLLSSGENAVIKIGPPKGELLREIHWYQNVTHSVPKIYAVDEPLKAFLMEYFQPGTPLKELVKLGHDDQATKIICEKIRNLQVKATSNFQFQHLSELSPALDDLEGNFAPKLLAQAKSLFNELTLDKSQDQLLHGDLHHDNILASGNNWKVIDPHGYFGEPVAEVGVMIRNPFDCFPSNDSITKTIKRRLAIMADELPFDRQKIIAWSFCMTMLSIAWTFADNQKINQLTQEVAFALNEITP